MNSRFLFSSLIKLRSMKIDFIRNGSFRSSRPVGDLNQYTTNYEITNDPKEWQYVENILFKKLIPEPVKKNEYPSGWKLAKETAKDLPYFITRTKNFMQPVYLVRKDRGMRRLTIIRKIKGDIWALEKDLLKYLEQDSKEKIPSFINELSGQIKLKGDHVSAIKRWIDDKGF